MLHTWAELYTRQLKKGQDHRDLRPAISIWLLDRNLFRNARTYRHSFCVHDPKQNVTLSDQLQIHTLELERWRRTSHGTKPQKPIKGWLDFFSGAEDWSTIPKDITSPQLEKAMSLLERFKGDLEWYALYSSQIDFERRQLTQQRAFAEAKDDLEAARAELKNLRQKRSIAEQQLTSSEQLRETAEQLLETTEKRLSSAEQQCQAAEQREAAEQQREAAEQQREAAEAREARLRELLEAHGIEPDV